MILVTGAAGYIGSVLSQALNGNAVRVDSFIKGTPRFGILQADTCDTDEMYSIMCKHGVESIINLAAIVGDPACAKYPQQAVRSNVEGVESLLKAAHRAGTVKKFVQASTCSVYGFNDDVVHEDSPLNPLSLYAETKVKAEKAIRTSGFPHAILRFATACGWSPVPRFDLTVNEFVKEAKLGRTIEVYRKDDWRPYCHTLDLAYVLKQAAVPGSTVMGTLNVGCARNNYTKQMIIDTISKYIPVSVNYVESAGTDADKRNYKVDFSAIGQAIKHLRFLTLDDAVIEIMDALDKGGIDADDRAHRADHLNI